MDTVDINLPAKKELFPSKIRLKYFLTGDFA